MYKLDLVFYSKSDDKPILICEIDGSSHFYSNTVIHPLGKTVIRDRILNSIEISFLTLPFYKYMDIKTGQINSSKLVHDVMTKLENISQ